MCYGRRSKLFALLPALTAFGMGTGAWGINQACAAPPAETAAEPAMAAETKAGPMNCNKNGNPTSLGTPFPYAVIPDPNHVIHAGSIPSGIATGAISLFMTPVAQLWVCLDANGQSQYIWGTPFYEYGIKLHAVSNLPVISLGVGLDFGGLSLFDISSPWLWTSEANIHPSSATPSDWKFNQADRDKPPPGYTEVQDKIPLPTPPTKPPVPAAPTRPPNLPIIPGK